MPDRWPALVAPAGLVQKKQEGFRATAKGKLSWTGLEKCGGGRTKLNTSGAMYWKYEEAIRERQKQKAQVQARSLQVGAGPGGSQARGARLHLSS
jgi:hypothetical protein